MSIASYSHFASVPSVTSDWNVVIPKKSLFPNNVTTAIASSMVGDRQLPPMLNPEKEHPTKRNLQLALVEIVRYFWIATIALTKTKPEVVVWE